MRLYKSYMFRTKDPVIDELRTMATDTYGTLKGAARRIEEDGGPRAGTVRNWWMGDVRRPQSAGVEAAGRAMGFQRTWVRLANGKPNLITRKKKR